MLCVSWRYIALDGWMEGGQSHHAARACGRDALGSFHFTRTQEALKTHVHACLLCSQASRRRRQRRPPARSIDRTDRVVCAQARVETPCKSSVSHSLDVKQTNKQQRGIVNASAGQTQCQCRIEQNARARRSLTLCYSKPLQRSFSGPPQLTRAFVIAAPGANRAGSAGRGARVNHTTTEQCAGTPAAGTSILSRDAQPASQSVGHMWRGVPPASSERHSHLQMDARSKQEASTHACAIALPTRVLATCTLRLPSARYNHDTQYVEPMSPTRMFMNLTVASGCCASTSAGTPLEVGHVPRATPGSLGLRCTG